MKLKDAELSRTVGLYDKLLHTVLVLRINAVRDVLRKKNTERKRKKIKKRKNKEGRQLLTSHVFIVSCQRVGKSHQKS